MHFNPEPKASLYKSLRNFFQSGDRSQKALTEFLRPNPPPAIKVPGLPQALRGGTSSLQGNMMLE
jgi:hypothetical protein